MPSLDIIIPIFNEKKNLFNVVKKISTEVKFKKNFIICYDSKNETGLKYLKNFKNIKKVKNLGHGPNEAILSGIKNSKSELILVYMADDYENINLINYMVGLTKKYDLIIPSRYVKGGVFENAKWYKKYIAIFGFVLINKIAGIPFKDSTNAFKLFKRSILKKINLKSKIGFTYALELTIKSYFSRYKIIEIPCVWRDLQGRKSNFKIIKWIPHYLYWFFYALIKKNF
tara:strand:+ start:84 stop:767 length:684 start_codon:yes stop_codon:yes gene_type:complete